MRQADVDFLRESASAFFLTNGWALPPNPDWDITDFGLGDWSNCGLVLINLANEPEYCEKIMYARIGMVTPMHHHGRKKEDIICRAGQLVIRFGGNSVQVIKRNGSTTSVAPGDQLVLDAGERVTISPGTPHEFEPLSTEVIIGEISTANDDVNDNYFANPNIGRFVRITE